MDIVGIRKVNDGKYLKNYELTYVNKVGKEKNMKLSAERKLKQLTS